MKVQSAASPSRGRIVGTAARIDCASWAAGTLEEKLLGFWNMSDSLLRGVAFDVRVGSARLFLTGLADPTRTSKATDRKSTRLNSSHQIISYAVFFLKKKT